MTQIAHIVNGQVATMSSREIAELTGKRHDNVFIDARRMLVELYEEEGVLKFQETYIHPQNGQSYMEFMLPKRETLILVSGYSVKMRAKIVDRWQELEAKTATPAPHNLSRMDILKIAMESEESRIKAEAERDHAIATKAQIGSRREATAMATAAAAKREAQRLKDQLGFSQRHATILQVEAATERVFDFVPLRRWCNHNGVKAETVPDKRYPGGVKAWPAAAWMAAYGVDLTELFSGEAA